MSRRIRAATFAGTVMVCVVVRDWLDSPDGGAGGFGARITMTRLFPR